MPTYSIGGELVRRKNLYLPCALAQSMDGLSAEEEARIYRQTWWADLIAASEWRALLREPGFSPSAKSRLKKKAAGWLIALGRIEQLDGELYGAVVADAQRLYREQVGQHHPLFRLPDDTPEEAAV